MKKTFLLWLFLATTFFANSQGNTLYGVDIIRPKAGMRASFEASWKLHLETFHKTSNKQTVYEVISGPNLGAYILVEGPFSFATMDTARPNAKSHVLDLDRNFLPKLEPGSKNYILRWVDTLSRNSTVQADKFVATTTVIKNGKLGEYLGEVRRGVLIQDKMNSPISINRLIMQFAGSNPTLVVLRNLKDGFAELEGGPNNPQFRSMYIDVYGQDAWDNRLKILVDNVVSSEVNLQIRRADLSSK